jgi:hypothetical protein
MKILKRKQVANECTPIRREAVMELLASKDEFGMVNVTVNYSPAYASLFDPIIRVFNEHSATEQ